VDTVGIAEMIEEETTVAAEVEIDLMIEMEIDAHLLMDQTEATIEEEVVTDLEEVVTDLEEVVVTTDTAVVEAIALEVAEKTTEEEELEENQKRIFLQTVLEKERNLPEKEEKTVLKKMNLHYQCTKEEENLFGIVWKPLNKLKSNSKLLVG